MSIKQIIKGFIRRRIISKLSKYNFPQKDILSAKVLAKKITACPEFSKLKFHPLAGKIKGNKQYFFNGSFTIFPWADRYLHLLMKLTKGVTEPQETSLFLDILKKMPQDAVIFQLGAGLGFYSILAGKHLPKAKLVLIEGNPRILKITKKNIKLNKLSHQATIIHAAVCDKDNKIVHFCEKGYGSFIREDGEYQVTSCSVDRVMQRLGIPKINMIFIDVQGAEESVLQGMNKALRAKAVDYVFIGTHTNELHKRCEWILNNTGYKTLISLNLDQSVGVDGILISQNPNYISKK